MEQPLKARIAVWIETGAQALKTGAGLAMRALAAVWSFVRPGLLFALNVVAALLLLFEEWGWQPLSNLLARLARFPLWAMTERMIAGLPPYGALLVLAVPSAVLIPAKLIGVYMFATGHFFVAMMVIFLAKLASTALIARIFLLTKPALMQIGWFARAYETFMPWKDRLFAYIRASWVWRVGRVIKWRTKHVLRDAWQRWRPALARLWVVVKPVIDRSVDEVSAFARTAYVRVAKLLRGEPRRNEPPRLLPPPDTSLDAARLAARRDPQSGGHP